MGQKRSESRNRLTYILIATSRGDMLFLSACEGLERAESGPKNRMNFWDRWTLSFAKAFTIYSIAKRTSHISASMAIVLSAICFGQIDSPRFIQA